MKPKIIKETFLVTEPEQAAAMLHPVRSALISLLKEPASATELAKEMNESPQKLNYHLKALEKVGLVYRAGTRNVRNLVEVLYQVAGKSFVLSDSLGMPQETIQKLKDQSALAHVLAFTEKIKSDTAALMEQADEEEVPTAIMEAVIQLSSKQQRNQFMKEYSELLKKLIQHYQARENEQSVPYQVSIAVYPRPKGGRNDESFNKRGKEDRLGE
ncbi:winged helix-turn-helix domain-containing protein [Fictibacillus iocasae]|uniref:Winged helix-turn-helix domain-containing protein n=1 Tax=Fictibacillus iocasae TaxID=2715437 RepID=A0ABW2NRP2_9BACL